MSKELKPMLADKAPANLTFPLYASAKIDGIRAIIKDGVVLGRSLKPIPNFYVQDTLGHQALSGLDGELVVGLANDHNVMQATTSGVMTREGEPDFTYWIFDFWTDTRMGYGDRLRLMQRGVKDHVLHRFPRVQLLPHVLVHNDEELQAFERVTLEEGFEGVMLRKPEGLYKYGRSTAREGHLLKLKRFDHGEAVVMGAEELLHNANEAKINALGLTERSSHKDNKIPMGVLGALNVVDVETAVAFSIGTGYTSKQRAELWELYKAGKLNGRIVRYKSFKASGVLNAPRFPVFDGFRDPIDMDTK